MGFYCRTPLNRGFTSKMSSLIDDYLPLVSLQGSRLGIHFSVSFLSKVFYVKKLYYTPRNAKKREYPSKVRFYDESLSTYFFCVYFANGR